MSHHAVRRRAAVAAVGVLAVLAAGCAPSLPASVVEGSQVTVGWSQRVTSLNAATTESDSEGNREVAAATHDQFARLADGEVVEDTSFGKVSVLDTDGDDFTVRYDLADRSWSDGIPIDTADLMLAWAAGSNATAGIFSSLDTELTQSTTRPTEDDFGRSIDVTFDEPVREWQTALQVAVPAHVVGTLALGVEDPMEAKQAVIDAITDDDTDALAAIAEVWNSGFDLDDADPDPSEAITVSSGAYRVDSVTRSGSGGDEVVLEINRSYTGDARPTYEQVDVVPDDSPLTSFPDATDVVQLLPTPDNYLPVRDLVRRDHHLATTDTGKLWVLVLRADSGLFEERAARRAFLRAAQPTELRSAGAGVWDDAYAISQSLLFSPGSAGYTVALEDAGLRTTFTTSDASADRKDAGVPAGTAVCVLYDTDAGFGAGAFSALRTAVADAGWEARDCGEQDIGAALTRGRPWEAALTAIDLPTSPEDITALWGGESPSPLTGVASPSRERLVAELAQTPDVYDAREIQVAVEAGLVKDAVALPLSMDPVLTLSERSMETVRPDSGSTATLLGGAVNWAPED